jgi:hypothetical protein
MRGAETSSGVAVKVFIKQERVALRGVFLEAEVCSVCWPPAVRVEQKQPQETALELPGDLTQMSS